MTKIADITDQKWINFDRIEVIQLWENDHPAIRQIGLFGDETGIIKFVSWERSKLPLLEQSAEYSVTKCAVSEYNGKKQVSMTALSQIKRVGAIQTELPVV